MSREGRTPYGRPLAAREEDPSHAAAARISGPLHGVGVGDEFGQASGTVFEGEDQVAEAGEVSPKVASEADTARRGALQWQLEDGEEPSRAGDPWGHEAELAQEALPIPEGAAVVGEALVYGVKHTVVAVIGEAQGLVDAVDEPAQDGFHGVPRGVPVSQFLDGQGLFGLVVLGRGLEVIVHCVQQQAAKRT